MRDFNFKASCHVTKEDYLSVQSLDVYNGLVRFEVKEEGKGKTTVVLKNDVVLKLIKVLETNIGAEKVTTKHSGVTMDKLQELAKSLGVKLGERLPEYSGAVIRVKDGSLLMLRSWNNMDGTGNKYAWTNGYRDVEVSEFGTDWEKVS